MPCQEPTCRSLLADETFTCTGCSWPNHCKSMCMYSDWYGSTQLSSKIAAVDALSVLAMKHQTGKSCPAINQLGMCFVTWLCTSVYVDALLRTQMLVLPAICSWPASPSPTVQRKGTNCRCRCCFCCKCLCKGSTSESVQTEYTHHQAACTHKCRGRSF